MFSLPSILQVFSTLKGVVKNNFKDDFDRLFSHLSASGKLVEDDMRSLMFGDYVDPDAMGEDRLYQEVTSMEEVKLTFPTAL